MLLRLVPKRAKVERPNPLDVLQALQQEIQMPEMLPHSVAKIDCDDKTLPFLLGSIKDN